MFTIKRVIRFWWLLPLVYVGLLIVYVLVLIGGVGHVPHAFDPFFYALSWPSDILNFFLPRAGTHSPVLNLILFVVIGLLTYSLIGCAIDIAIQRYRRR